MNKFNLLLIPHLFLQSSTEFSWATILPFLPLVASLLTLVVYLTIYLFSMKSGKKANKFSTVFPMIISNCLEIIKQFFQPASPTEPQSKSSECTSTEQSQEQVTEQSQEQVTEQVIEEIKRECPIYTCPFHDDENGCRLTKCAYFEGSDTKRSLENLAIETSAFLDKLYEIFNKENK